MRRYGFRRWALTSPSPTRLGSRELVLDSGRLPRPGGKRRDRGFRRAGCLIEHPGASRRSLSSRRHAGRENFSALLRLLVSLLRRSPHRSSNYHLRRATSALGKGSITRGLGSGKFRPHYEPLLMRFRDHLSVRPSNRPRCPGKPAAPSKSSAGAADGLSSEGPGRRAIEREAGRRTGAPRRR